MVPDESRIKLAVGEHFRRTRETLGWTLSDVTERAAREGATISVSMLSRLERGQSAFSMMDTLALCRSLGTSASFLEDVIKAATTKTQVDLSRFDINELINRGKRRLYRGDTEEARAFFEAAVDWVLLNPESRARLPEALVYCAEVHRRERRFHLATEILSRVLNTPDCTTEQRVQALVQNVAIGYLTGDFSRARVYAGEVLKLVDAVASDVRAFALGTIAALEMKQDRYNAALPLLNQALAIYEELRSAANHSRMLACVGYCRCKTGQRGGLKDIDDAIEIALENGFSDVALLGHQYYAEVCAAARELEDARKHLESATKIARSIGSKNDTFLCWYHLWSLESECGNHESATRAGVVLARMLKSVDNTLPEYQRFVASMPPRKRGTRR